MRNITNCTPEQKTILDNCLKLNDEQFEICKDFFIKSVKENKERLKERKKIKDESNSFNYDENDLENEYWKEYPFNKHYRVSSLGRVKYDGKILHQVEQKKNDIVVKDGWVLLEQNPDMKVLTYYVYTLVAKTFLGKIDGDGYGVHHITNNGCDNSVNNLILLTKTQHIDVHRYKI